MQKYKIFTLDRINVWYMPPVSVYTLVTFMESASITMNTLTSGKEDEKCLSVAVNVFTLRGPYEKGRDD